MHKIEIADSEFGKGGLGEGVGTGGVGTGLYHRYYVTPPSISFRDLSRIRTMSLALCVSTDLLQERLNPPTRMSSLPTAANNSYPTYPMRTTHNDVTAFENNIINIIHSAHVSAFQNNIILSGNMAANKVDLADE